MKKYSCLILVFVLFSCKSKAKLLEGNASNSLTAEKVIENHYNNKTDFSTLYIKASAKYKDEKQSQSVTAEIKIKKNEIILVSIRFIGITMAKAYITPKEVKYYDKINNNYFEGDYTGLSKWLGTDLDFDKVQNLLIGRAIDDLHKSNFIVSVMNEMYKLVDNSNENDIKSYVFESDTFLIKQQEINQPNSERAVQIVYPEYKKYDELILPFSFQINTNTKNKKANITVEYKNVSINENLSFPYSVPEGFERIVIEKL